MCKFKACLKAAFLALCLVFSFSMKAAGLPLKMNNGQELDAYGILLFDQGSQTNQIVSFKIPSVDSFNSLFSMGSLYATAGACVDGKYYFVSTAFGTTSSAPDKLYCFDLDTQATPEEVGSITGIENKVNAITYDYSTGTMFLVACNLGATGEQGFGALYTIDIKNAAVTKVADLDRYFFAMACTYDGQLYGVTKYGDFCKINKTDGAVEVIGATGYSPTGDSSLEFNHTDGTLYWAVNSMIPGYGDTNDILCTIDLATGKATEVGTLGSAGDASITGMYIPFNASATGTPDAVSDFVVTPDANGACKATLEWFNPSTVFNGGELASLKQVDIYRNDELIESLADEDAKTPGVYIEYVDEIEGETGLLVEYKVVPVNEVGNGVEAVAEVYVGKDVPAAPGSVSVVKNAPDDVTIAWTAPETGLNGGWIDRASLVYTVKRGEVTVADGISELTFNDKVTEISTYTYEVIASTANGEGGKVVAEPVVLGPANKMPYNCTFTTEELKAWQIVDADNDGRVWSAGYTGGMQYNNPTYPPSTTASDDWLISHSFYLEAGKNYKFAIDIKTSSSGAANLKMCLGKEGTVEAMTTTLLDLPDYRSEYLNYSYQWNTEETMFTVEETGYYNIGIYTYSAAKTGFLYVNNVSLEQIADNNLLLDAFTGPAYVVAGNSYTYTATVLNKGKNAASSYSVNLINAESGETLATAASAAALEAGASAELTLVWTPESEGNISVAAKVDYDADEIESDDTSDAIAVEVRPAGSAEYVELAPTGWNQYAIASLYYKYAVAQNVYTAEELGHDCGVIESYSFYVNSSSPSAVEAVPFKVYMANTSAAPTDRTWIPESEWTLVYDGTIDIPDGQSTVKVTLDKKFQLEKGKNLAVFTTHDLGDKYYSGVVFGTYSIADSYGTYYYTSSWTEFSYSSYGSSLFNQKAAIALDMQCSGAVISGTLTDADGNPVAGALVTLSGDNITTTSDENGEYAFYAVKDGSYTVTVNAERYHPAEAEVTVDGGDAVKDFQLEELSYYKVSGKVVLADGSPLADATVTVVAIDEFTATTGADGAFAFDEIPALGEACPLTVEKEWFATAETEFTLTDGDLDLGNISAEYLKYRPVNVSAVPTEDMSSVDVSWADADAAVALRVDEGTSATSMGIDNATDKTVLGTVYREPVVLDGISWYQTSAGGPHYYVTAYVFALDGDGNPTGNVLYQQDVNVPADNQWVEVALDEKIYAPDGCVVALGYEGYLGVGADSGKSFEYPFLKNRHVFAATYTNGDFDYIEDHGMAQNLMIRATGKRLADNGGEESEVEEGSVMPDFCKYNVYRLSETQISTPDAWTLVKENAETAEFTDTPADLPDGVYAYAVRTVYPDGTMSEASMSQFVGYHMYTKVTVNVKSNSEGEGAKGALVSMTGRNRQHSYSVAVGESGQVVLPEVVKDKYDMAITLEGYETVNVEIDFSTENIYTTETYLLKEVISDPVNLAVENYDKNAKTALFTWNTSAVIFDDFEDHEDFAINSPGKAGWEYWDLDGQPTWGFDNASFEGNGDYMSFMVFNPSAAETTNPDMPLTKYPMLAPHSGNKYLASFAALVQNDDWLISPELSYAHDFQFSFYASSAAQAEGMPDYFSVGYSMVDEPEEDDFVWMAERLTPFTYWMEYSYTIPAGAKRVAIRNVSNADGWILMLDDIYIGSLPQKRMMKAPAAEDVQRPAVSYNVYLDGNLVATTDQISYRFVGLKEGAHTASVEAVYYSGTSKLESVRFGEDAGIGGIYGSQVKVYPNPTSGFLKVEGDYTHLTLMNANGVAVKAYEGLQDNIDLSDLPAGIYFLNIENKNTGANEMQKVSIVK
ncbi:MAG: carboxypeptidase regulatory-like domain-containing protein [Bacteroidetes bacterium]|uniref:Carboxypeptidase regulatory-like domain-containing protein n=1 Tax=Candidatus Limisoma faecipullorum TaxID=2840854 RepID=A0A9D9ISD5_9BACT|nr:carboxypeptidase regulatory-like domain-containing protein [Candidatus Limisoma faecipullorum]